MGLKDIIRNWRERLKQRGEANARRQEVARDGRYYCQTCGKRDAQLMSSMVAERGAFCSEACGSRFAQRVFRYDVEMGGGSVIGGGFGGSMLLSSLRGSETKRCMWCGHTIDFNATTCELCSGGQERRTNP